MKKISRVILILLLSLLLIIIIAVIVLKISNESFIGSADKQSVEYLDNHNIVLNEKEPNLTSFFNKDVYEKNIILLGETHGYADVQEVDKSLFIHFNKTKGTRFYIAEMDSNCSHKLNTFLAGERKDTTILKEVITLVKRRIPQQAGLELFQKWSDIYDYNKTLPDSLKISVLGIDKSVDDKSKILRDSAMMINFSDIIKRKGLENESFYGFFGLFHVLQDGVNSHNAQSFAARAKKEGFNIKSIVCLNIDSEVYMPKNDQFPTPENEKISFLNMDGPIVLAKGIKDLKEASKENTITLFNLEQENSPYRSSQKLITNKTNFINQDLTPYDVNSVTTDFFQYVVFLRNAKAITPIK